MLKKTVSIIIMLCVLASVLSACGEEKEVSFVVPIPSDPLCLDPQIVDNDTSRLIVNNCYEGLVRLNEKYEIIPGVAESWDISSDGLTYTFHLRSDTNWQLLKSFSTVLEDENYMDNFKTTVTAYDFQFGLMRTIDPVTQSKDAEKLLCIKNAEQISSGSAKADTLGVNAVNDTTLIISLARANSDFLRLLTLPGCMPCNEEFFNATHAKYGLELKYTFCNGPFYLGKWVEDNSITLYKNEGYKGETAVTPVAVYLYINKDEASIVKRMKQYSYDCAYLSDSSYSELSENSNISRITASTSVTGLTFNCSDEVLKNVNIRKALIMMTNLESIGIPENATAAASGVVPDCCRFGDKRYREEIGNISPLGYDEKTALALWEKGLKELDIESVGIAIICKENDSSRMQKAIQRWQKLLGTQIIAKVEIKTQDEIDSAISGDTYQIAVNSITTKSSTAIDTLKTFTTESNENIFNYSDTKYDAIVNGIIHTYGGNELKKQYKAAEQMIVSNAVFCPIYTTSSKIVIGKNVSLLFASPALETISFLNGGKA